MPNFLKEKKYGTTRYNIQISITDRDYDCSSWFIEPLRRWSFQQSQQREQGGQYQVGEVVSWVMEDEEGQLRPSSLWVVEELGIVFTLADKYGRFLQRDIGRRINWTSMWVDSIVILHIHVCTHSCTIMYMYMCMYLYMYMNYYIIRIEHPIVW